MRNLPRTFLPFKEFMGAKGRDAGQRVTFGEYWTSASTPGVAYEFTWLGATGECCLVRRQDAQSVAETIRRAYLRPGKAIAQVR